MSANSFTPAPWTLETVTTSCGICHKIGPFPARRDSDSPRHACLYSDHNSAFNPADQELLANARLMAASPDLLEALESYVTTMAIAGGGDKALFMAAIREADNKARAAIAKATRAQP